jgi:hypothetical protein
VPWEVAGIRRDICIHVLGNRLCERPEAEHALPAEDLGVEGG